MERKRWGEMLSTDEVADRMGVTPKTLRTYIREGKVRAIRFGRHWKITKEEVERVMLEGTGEWKRKVDA